YPNPRTNEVWSGLVDYADDDGDPAGGVEDSTEEEAPPPKPTPKASVKGKAAPPPTVEEETEGDESAEDEGISPDGGDLDSLAELADSTDKKRVKERTAAQKQLTEM